MFLKKVKNFILLIYDDFDYRWNCRKKLIVSKRLIAISKCISIIINHRPMPSKFPLTLPVSINLSSFSARATIQNYYQYRHIESPGWSLGWAWTKGEVIWTMSGAFATVQGDCSSFKYRIPHSCKTNPVIADLTPYTSPRNMSENCCRGGLISSYAIDPKRSYSVFEMTVGNLEPNSTGYPPANLTLLAPGPGYTCSQVSDADPTKSSDIGGKREIQVFRTWKSTCTYSSFLASETPNCCVSLSTFYNPKVTSCPECSCGCKGPGQMSGQCIRDGKESDIVECSDHMCPVRVHWHVKTNYVDHWRVKVTISNYNYVRNYSDWNLLIQHPGFRKNTTVYSFSNTMLPSAGYSDEVALFWGLPYVTDVLVQVSNEQAGSVTTDILIKKDLQTFTLRNGWAMPRRIYFSGEECAMPLPDTFPALPNDSSRIRPLQHLSLFLLVYWTFQTLLIRI
ncbi:hypothetical protein K2173_017921 [Erythroxylum novogranatense]|uniref:COBRA-like protein n=1 Tax=Erythroxylum novogranatense TaxID=1862640 RepID=A0AAV8TL00_9ROSI|nr:hypothetical protein K2173_017921 [Erythroxylum novogranatense]